MSLYQLKPCPLHFDSAENQPLTHVIEAIRAWLVGTLFGNSGWIAFVWCISIIIVSMPVATWLFKRKDR